MDLLVASGIAGIGYFLSKDGRKTENLNPKNTDIPENQKPSSVNTYNTRYLDNVRKMEFEKANAQHEKSLFPEQTGIIGAAYKNRQDHKHSRPYSLRKSMILDEKDVIKKIPIVDCHADL